MEHDPAYFAPFLHALIDAHWNPQKAANDCVQLLQEETAGLIIIGIGSSGRMTLTQALVREAFPQNTQAFVLSIGSENISTHLPHPEVLLHTVPQGYSQRIADGQYSLAVFSNLHTFTEWTLWHRLCQDRACSVIAHISPYNGQWIAMLLHRLLAVTDSPSREQALENSLQHSLSSRPFMVIAMKNPLFTHHYGVREIIRMDPSGTFTVLFSSNDTPQAFITPDDKTIGRAD